MIKKILLYLWQLPQHLLALILLIFFKPLKKENYKHTTVHTIKFKNIGGLSLGNYVFVQEFGSEKLVKHEYGHSRQSIYLGPLYLLVVGLPSISMNTLSGIAYKFGYYKLHDNYYNRFPENWADKLGEVDR